jgi:polyhydroxyalkanoate synthesis regulator phasin
MQTVSRKQFELAVEATMVEIREQAAAVHDKLSKFIDDKLSAGQLDADAAAKCKAELQQQFDDVLERARNTASDAEQRLFAPHP